MHHLETFLEKYYAKDEPVILACSTGPDSMYLLYKILETKFAKNIVACYFNHKLRKEADEEEVFLEDLGKKLGFKVEIAEADIQKIKEKYYTSISTEELARKKRYEFFDAIMHIYKTDKILTAHHLDDKIETFFFNLARGSKITGLVNMKEASNNKCHSELVSESFLYKNLISQQDSERPKGMLPNENSEGQKCILRPLLDLQKSEILAYLEKNNLEYKIDETNFQNDFTRNKLRNQILPQFSEINSNYKKNISAFMDYLGEVKEMIDFEVEKFLKIPPTKGKKNNISLLNKKYLEEAGKNSFLISDFNSLSPFLQKEIIRYIFFIRNGNSTIGLSSANIAEVLKFINGKNNKTIKEIKNMKLEKDNKVIWY